MSAVAAELRRLTIERILALSPAERIALALHLGDDDLALFARVQNIPHSEALRRLRQTRQRGRTPSRCGDPGA